MKKVFIKYNPYKLETEITVNGKKEPEDSILSRVVPRTCMQEWVEKLPQLLQEEYNDTDFEVTFYGRLLDYEDLAEAFTEADKNKGIKATLKWQQGKKIPDRKILIDEVFKKIQEGPFEELRSEEIKKAFEHTKSIDFEVCVMADLSAGKSTLINAMLGNKLIPSSEEACTAIITRLKDNDNDTWQAEVYNKDNRLIEIHEKLNHQIMENLNNDMNVLMVKAFGNIPFVTAEDVSLVLVDTPNPNWYHGFEHGRMQYGFLQPSSKSLILYIMDQVVSTDDDDLLRRVSGSMSVGGKQSKDRFLFVVNKMDDRKKEDGDTQQMVNRVREYLGKHGIENPNLFPVAALPALNIRMIEKGVELDEDTVDETELKVRKLNRNEQFHLENYATLPGSVFGKIKDELSKAEESYNKNEQALIHTGVPSVEIAICRYVQKYVEPAIIKNMVDTFIHKLDEVECLEKIKRELASRQDEEKIIEEKMEKIRKFLIHGDKNDTFREIFEEAFTEKLERLEKLVVEKEKIEEQNRELECKLQWLQIIQSRLESILEI